MTKKSKISKIVYQIVHKWTQSKRFGKYALRHYDNWKDDLIDNLYEELKKEKREKNEQTRID